jgi:hypothetical protein
MSNIKKKGSGGEPNPLENQLLTADGLKNKLAQLSGEELFYELEAVEVVDIYRIVDANPDVNPRFEDTDGFETSTIEDVEDEIEREPNLSAPGAILGRYIESEQGDNVDELQEFFPLDSNILQMPVVGEVVLGMEFDGQRYYFGKLNRNIEELNFQRFNVSTVNDLGSYEGYRRVLNSNVEVDNYKQGDYFVDTFQPKQNLDEGDTAIQGRFGNSIVLGSNQKNGNLFSPNVKIKAELSSSENTSSMILMTTNEKIDYNEPTKTYAKKSDSVNTSTVFEGFRRFTTDYTKPQILLNSDRIVLNAEKEDIGIFAQGKVFIRGNNIEIHNQGQMQLVTKDMVNNFVDGKKSDIKKDLNDPDNKILPKGLLELGGIIKPTIEFFKKEIQSLAYLILPPTLPGGIPNPSFMLGMKIKFDAIKDMLELIEKFIKLDFVPDQEFETISLNRLKKELGIPVVIDLPNVEQNYDIDELLEDAQKARLEVDKMQAQVAGVVASAAALNGIADLLAGEELKDVDTNQIIQVLDEYDADPNNPPLDSSDLRDVIADGANGEDLRRYFDNGGSPQINDLLQKVGQAEQDAKQLSQIVKLSELLNRSK